MSFKKILSELTPAAGFSDDYQNEFKPGDKARLRNLDEFGPSDWCLEEDEYEELLEHEGDLVTIYDIATDGYYDVECDTDGYEINAISGYHLERV